MGRTTLPGFLLLSVILVWSVGLVYGSNAGSASEKLVTLSFNNEPLGNIIKDVSSQTGYKIEISESLLSQRVTGQYVDIDIDSFLRRIFKGVNVFQIIDSNNKVVKIYSSLREKGKTVFVNAGPADEYGDIPLDGQADKTLSTLMRDRDMLFESIDVSRIPLDGGDGVTTAELNKRRDEFTRGADLDTIPLDSQSGSTPAELKKKQQDFYESADVDNMSLDVSGGTTPRQLTESRDRFYQTVDVGDIPLDEVSGVTPNSLRKKVDDQAEK